jgi:tRNA_anti-like
MKLNIILVVGIALLTLGISACSTATTPNKSAVNNVNAKNNPASADTNANMSSKPFASVSAPELSKEFMANIAATKEKYLNKELIVSGKIKLVQKAVNAFYLETNTTKNLDAILCQFDGEMPSNLKEGQEVKVKGILQVADGVADMFYILKLRPCEVQ